MSSSPIFNFAGNCSWCGWPRGRANGCLVCKSPAGRRELLALVTPPEPKFTRAAIGRIARARVFYGSRAAVAQAAYEAIVQIVRNAAVAQRNAWRYGL